MHACVKPSAPTSSKGPTAPFALKLRRHESVSLYLLSIPLSFPSSSSLSTSYACFPCALRPRNFDGFRETDLSRLLPSFRDSLDTSWSLQYRSMWPARNRRIRCLCFTSSFFPVFFLPPLRTSVASCRYVEFFMNTLQTIHSQRAKTEE